MRRILIIAEKPSAAKKIAYALSDKGVRIVKVGKTPIYATTFKGQQIYVAYAMGHLYNIVQKSGGWIFPVYNIKWERTSPKDRSYNERIKETIQAIAKIAREVDEIVVACDYDIEGSLIGYNVVKYACGEKYFKKSSRMIFSTLTRNELRKAFDRRLKTLDWPVIEAGKMRHEIDWIFGINLSRALTLSLRRVGDRERILSIGRVQGPTLKLLAEREIDINTHVPLPYWKARAIVEINGVKYVAEYAGGNIESEEKALEIKKIRDKYATVKKIERKVTKERPPPPFNLGELQREAYRIYRISPGKTLEISEKLYLQALISYPRTGSEQIPDSIDVKGIIEKLGEMREYRDLVQKIFEHSKRPKPVKGKGTDPAHPAIHPTGEKVNIKLSGNDRKIYDLIVRRFLASCYRSMTKSETRALLDIEGHLFVLKGVEIIDHGWLKIYPFKKVTEKPFPRIVEGMKLKVIRVEVEEKYTKPKPRYNVRSLLKKMENLGLGTKATRAEIIEILFSRRYLENPNNIEVTDLGMKVSEILSKICPEILSVELTRNVEQIIDELKSEYLTSEYRKVIVANTVLGLYSVLSKMKKNEINIGQSLVGKDFKPHVEGKPIGRCPVCGNQLLIVRSKKTKKRFIVCYGRTTGECDVTQPLPQKGRIRPLHETCKYCGYPLLACVSKGKEWVFCTNIRCPGKRKNV
ncbi:MAG TPA: DNA topoisomerase I [Candidatus Bathyarchaeota archaeon]|nr:DNA topoisomerase I [Candidatus Bathyarchaeota archaeon]